MSDKCTHFDYLNTPRNILWMSWKDISNPHAGGAERVTHELLSRLVMDGHKVILVTAGYSGAKSRQKIKVGQLKTKSGKVTVASYQVIRLGDKYTVYSQAFLYYRRQLRGWADVLIEEINTIPFMTSLYAGTIDKHEYQQNGKRLQRWLFVHQLCREIWFHQLSWPLSTIGYMVEPLYLWMLSHQHVLTVSESTKTDLISYGFKPSQIKIVTEGIDLQPVDQIKDRGNQLTLLSFGAMRSMKQTIDQITAFKLVKAIIPDARLLVAGDQTGAYGNRVMRAVEQSPYKSDIMVFGRVDQLKKKQLLRKSHLLLSTSVKEGWGLVVSEASSQGLPTIAYDVDGLRDSVSFGQSGRLTRENTPQALATEVVSIWQDQKEYLRMQKRAVLASRKLTFQKSYLDLTKYIDHNGKEYDDNQNFLALGFSGFAD